MNLSGLYRRAKAAFSKTAARVVKAATRSDITRYAGRALLGSQPRAIPPREWLQLWMNMGRKPADRIVLAYPGPKRAPEGPRYDQLQRRNRVPKFRHVNYEKELGL